MVSKFREQILPPLGHRGFVIVNPTIRRTDYELSRKTKVSKEFYVGRKLSSLASRRSGQ